jgi:hypothetical protein
MQMNQPSSFPFSGGKPNRSIPGLKVAYGSQAQQQPVQYQNPAAQKPISAPTQSLFSRLKASLFHMVTEEAANERPIGISQLSHTTFQASPDRDTTSFFKNSQPIQDYRFNQLVDPRLINPRR